MKRFVIVLCGIMLVGCTSWWNNDDDDTNSQFKGMSSKQLYTEAKKSLVSEQYTSASKRLEALESMYPFSEYTESAQLLLIYTYYKDGEYPAASAEAEHFTHLYPRSPHVDYAYYMKGLADFQQPRTALGRILSMDESWRDPGTQLQAYTDFITFTEKFPKSIYYNDALMRLIYLRNQFAQRELNNAEFYFERKMYVAAAGRASYLVQTYPQAPSVERALTIMYRSYTILGLKQDAQDALAAYQSTYHR
jgi:outer membrane protein assembly factor BamD